MAVKPATIKSDFDACHGNPRLRLSSLTRMRLISCWDCLPPSSCLSFLRRVSDVHLFTTVTFKAHDEQPSQLPNSSISPQIAEDVKLRFVVYERIEGAKQRMMIELDKPMMEAAKELEL
ncbi:hypothetical protein Bca4012_050876 [Brassica carinata]